MANLGINANLQQKLSTKLVIAPQLAQSLKILAMNSLKLESYVESCLEQNPLLERVPDADTPVEIEYKTDDALQLEFDGGWESLHINSQRDGDMVNVEAQPRPEDVPLYDSLHRQLGCEPMSEQTRSIACAIVDSLDDDGYYRCNPDETARICQSDATTIVQVLQQVVQSLDPAGIGARDLVECLLLQLRESDNEDSAVIDTATQLLLYPTESLGESDEYLTNRLDCSIETLNLARKRLRQLDPSPGLNQAQPDLYIRPELGFRLLQTGSVEVEVFNTTGTAVRMTEQWNNHTWTGKDKAFMEKSRKEACELLHALSQRAETLLKVGLFLADYQRAFLEHGIVAIKPLTLQVVADACGLHESTISRVTNGKYAQTPLGPIDMHRFFSAGLNTRSGETIAISRVLRRIQCMIEAESPQKPLSDQAILTQLTREGIEIARRTVAKYREGLGFPSSTKRKVKEGSTK